MRGCASRQGMQRRQELGQPASQPANERSVNNNTENKHTTPDQRRSRPRQQLSLDQGPDAPALVRWGRGGAAIELQQEQLAVGAQHEVDARERVLADAALAALPDLVRQGPQLLRVLREGREQVAQERAHPLPRGAAAHQLRAALLQQHSLRGVAAGAVRDQSIVPEQRRWGGDDRRRRRGGGGDVGIVIVIDVDVGIVNVRGGIVGVGARHRRGRDAHLDGRRVQPRTHVVVDEDVPGRKNKVRQWQQGSGSKKARREGEGR